MKKLVTLSAIALAGATLGVGTTFGWWADDTDDQPVKVKTKTLEVIPDDLQPKAVEVFFKGQVDNVETKEGNPKVVIVQSKSPDGKSESVESHIRFVQAGVNAQALEKLADELTQEAKEFEGHGQKEAAEIQRKLAERLRATLKANQSHFKAWQSGGKLDKVPNEKIDEHVRQKLGVLHLELKGRDPEPKKNPDAYIQELKARIQEIQANPKAHENAEAQLRKLQAAVEQQARLASEKDQDQARHVKARQMDQVVAQLKETAEKLEQAGQKEQARGVREKIEHILRDFDREASDDPKRKPEKHEIILDDKSGKIIRFRKEIKEGAEDQELAIIRLDPKGVEKGAGKEKGPAVDHEVIARIKGEHPAHVDGAPLIEVQKMLKELHHEIQELREEVRGLRGLLGDKPVSGKQKVRDDDDKPQGDEGKARKTLTKDPKPKVRHTLSDDDDDKRDGEKKNPDAEKRDDDDDDDAKSENRKEKDGDDKKSEDREEKNDDDKKSEDRVEKDDESAQAKRAFNFYIGLMR